MSVSLGAVRSAPVAFSGAVCAFCWGTRFVVHQRDAFFFLQFALRTALTTRGCQWVVTGPLPRDALEGEGPHRRPQKRLDRRLQEVAKAVGGGYCRLQMLLRLALAVRETVAGHRLAALEGGGGYLPVKEQQPDGMSHRGATSPPSNAPLLLSSNSRALWAVCAVSA